MNGEKGRHSRQGFGHGVQRRRRQRPRRGSTARRCARREDRDAAEWFWGAHARRRGAAMIVLTAGERRGVAHGGW